ncbi:MAG: hypothetical protein JXA89_14010 [Anaerolineae bacterium]|nr:hypothetical protein [Anaerolineae bacterium]
MDLDKSKLFTPITHPETGLSLYLLTEKVAPVQQNFYFVNSGMTDDARFLWFYCAFPPSPVKTLGVIDFEAGTVRHVPQTQFNGSTPYVDPASGTVFWGARESIWRLSPTETDAMPDLVNSLPPDVVRTRTVHRLATHLTRSADGTEFLVDAALGIQWILGTLPLDGGDFQLWHRFDRNYNHAQFSPTDPDMALFAEENHPDPITGLRFPIVDRMWLIRRGEHPRPVYDEPTRVTHEWWDADGEHVWCVWGHESWRTHIETCAVEKIAWPAHCWHAHNSINSDFLICDSNEKFFRGCPSAVYFLNRHSGKTLKLVDNPGMGGITGSSYHIDPHPRFCGQDQFVVFTTTIRGEVDLAIVKTADLVDRTA